MTSVVVELRNLYLVAIGDCEFACEKYISLPHITNYFRMSLKDRCKCISFKLVF